MANLHTPLRVVLDEYPYPVASVYARFWETDPPGSAVFRIHALWFTAYQLLRVVGVGLVSQYLREERLARISNDDADAVNGVIKAIQRPSFGDWLDLVRRLSKQLAGLGVPPLFPGLAGALENQTKLDTLVKLRNDTTGHGGLVDPTAAESRIAQHTGVLHDVLRDFDFLREVILQVRPGGGEKQPGETLVLRGSGVAGGFAGSAGEHVILATPWGPELDLYPFAHVLAGGTSAGRGPGTSNPSSPARPAGPAEPVYLYDGYQYSSRSTRGSIVYLGNSGRIVSPDPVPALEQLFTGRGISLSFGRKDTRPWTIAVNGAYHTKKALTQLHGSRYLPECYHPLDELERVFDEFLRVPPSDAWKQPSYPGGFLLAGLTGSGKTAFLARQAQRLLEVTENGGDDPLDVVVFLRGSDLPSRSDERIVWEALAQRLGITPDDAPLGARKGGSGGFSGLGDLLGHLHAFWSHDRCKGRRFVLILDAVNEAPFPESAARSALQAIADASLYPWAKVIVSIREEWLDTWRYKLAAHEKNPFEQARKHLFLPAQPAGAVPRRSEGVAHRIEPFSELQARRIYESYQAQAGEHGVVPACLTAWEELGEGTRRLLQSRPLYLHLFMESHAGRHANPITNQTELFQHYVEGKIHEQDGLERPIQAVVSQLIRAPERQSATLTEEDYGALRLRWAQGKTPEEIRSGYDPVESLKNEGLLVEQGDVHRFNFQAVAEYLIYWYLEANAPDGDPTGYWCSAQTAPPRVFPEYEGAFVFLLRVWAAQGRQTEIALLVERGPDWFESVLSSYLLEQALLWDIDGRSQAVAGALRESGGPRTAGALSGIAFMLLQTRFVPAAVSYFRAAVTVRERLRDQQAPEGEDLGQLASDSGGLAIGLGQSDPEEAEKIYHRTIELYASLHARFPQDARLAGGYAATLANLSVHLHQNGRASEAREYVQRALEIYRGLQPPECAGTAAAYLNLGNVYISGGRYEDARVAFGNARDLYEELLREDPETADLQHGLALSLSNYANMLLFASDFRGAERLHARAIEIYEVLSRREAANVTYDEKFCMALGNYASLLSVLGRVEEGLALAGKAAHLAGYWWRQGARQPDLLNQYLFAHEILGGLEQTRGDLPAAEKHYGHWAEVVLQFGDVLGADAALLSLADARAKLGALYLLQRDRREEGEEYCELALAMYSALRAKGQMSSLKLLSVLELLVTIAAIKEEKDDFGTAGKILKETRNRAARLMRQHPRHLFVQILNAGTLLAHGRHLLRSLQDGTPGDSPAPASPGALKARVSRFAVRRRALSQLRKARSELAEMSRAAPDHLQIRYDYARCLAALGEWETARVFADQLLESLPGNHYYRYLKREIEVERVLPPIPLAERGTERPPAGPGGASADPTAREGGPDAGELGGGRIVPQAAPASGDDGLSA